MELKKAVEKLKEIKENCRYKTYVPNEQRDEWKQESQAIDTVLNRLNDLENRYLELIINGKSFKIKNDVKELQYIDYENKEFTLEVLEKWN